MTIDTICTYLDTILAKDEHKKFGPCAYNQTIKSSLIYIEFTVPYNNGVLPIQFNMTYDQEKQTLHYERSYAHTYETLHLSDPEFSIKLTKQIELIYNRQYEKYLK